jgi:Rod binding domain-containing protein
MLLKAMRSTVGKGGLFREGGDTQMFREMFDEEVGRAIARSGGGIGLAQMILRDEERRDAGAVEKKAQGPALDNR